LNCDDVLSQLADYLDEDARAELCREIEGHLFRCKDCRLQVDTLKKTIVLYQNDRPVEMPPRVSEKLAAALSIEYERRDGSAH